MNELVFETSRRSRTAVASMENALYMSEMASIEAIRRRDKRIHLDGDQSYLLNLRGKHLFRRLLFMLFY